MGPHWKGVRPTQIGGWWVAGVKRVRLRQAAKKERLHNTKRCTGQVKGGPGGISEGNQRFMGALDTLQWVLDRGVECCRAVLAQCWDIRRREGADVILLAVVRQGRREVTMANEPGAVSGLVR